MFAIVLRYVLDPKTHSEKKALTTLSCGATEPWRCVLSINSAADGSSQGRMAVPACTGLSLCLRNKALLVSLYAGTPLCVRHAYGGCSTGALA
jgi:hypothetical protein